MFCLKFPDGEGKFLGFDGDGCAVPPVSSVTFVIGTVVVIVGCVYCLFVL